MTLTDKTLYDLLPALYRIRDFEQDESLRAFLSVIAEQVEALEESLSQSYDDQFIETSAEWAIPYIGDLIGYRTLYGIAPKIASRRAEVANTIGYRRRKGTASVLEQLARDVTGWPARVVEFFELLVTTQFMNHVRLHNNVTPDLREWEPLERLNSAFETTPHLIDVRRIGRSKGKYNIPNIGIFLWRLQDYSLTHSPFIPEGSPETTRRFRFHPLGIDMPLFTNAQAEDFVTHLAEPLNVPLPISRRVFDAFKDQYYGVGETIRSIALFRGHPDAIDALEVVPSSEIHCCDLSDIDGGADWAHVPQQDTDPIAIDPVLGRIALPPSLSADSLLPLFHYGFSSNLGGGEYERADTFEPQLSVVQTVTSDRTDTTGLLLQEALDQAAGGGVVSIEDSWRYDFTNLSLHPDPPSSLYLSVDSGASNEDGIRVEFRAQNGHRPTLVVPQGISVVGGDHSTAILNGLLITGGPIRIPDSNGNSLRRVILRHCTLVPGLALEADSTPVHPERPSLIVELADITVVLDHCIVGGLQAVEGTNFDIRDSIVDATDPANVAFAAVTVEETEPAPNPGGILRMENTTVIGKVSATAMPLVSNSIFFGKLHEEPEEDLWPSPVLAKKKQIGCVRFSYVPPGSQVPRRYRCQPDLAVEKAIAEFEEKLGHAGSAIEYENITQHVQSRIRPSFTMQRYGHPAYCQLRQSVPVEIRTGADDESEMGVFHHLYQPQREKNLRIRLDEYLRVGLEAGLFFGS